MRGREYNEKYGRGKPEGDDEKAEYENVSLVIFQSIPQHKI
jgi:hypothetical protein